MKKKSYFSICFTLLLVFLLGVVACTGDGEPQGPQTLSAPQNVQSVRRIVTWDPVENAMGYVVRFKNTEYETKECTLDLFSHDTPGTYRVEVMARGDGVNHLDSAWTSVEHVVQEILTEGYDSQRFYYKLLADGTGYEIHRGLANMEGEITLPSYFCDLPVKRIGDYGMVGKTNSNIHPNNLTTAIHMPEHLESIGQYAIYGVSKITEIVIPDTVVEIEFAAFGLCKSLTKVTLPKGLKTIGDSAFQYTPLGEINLPDQLETIGNSAFDCWTNGNLTHYVPSKVSSVTIPESVKSIGNYAFRGHRYLTTVTVPDANIEYMGKNVFDQTPWYEALDDGYIYFGKILYQYKGVLPENTVIELPQGIKVAGGAFAYQVNLQKIVVPTGTKLMGDGIFAGCTALSEIILPADLKEIHNEMFDGTKALKSISLPEGVLRIGELAFVYSAIESISIPSSVKVIETNAFAGCRFLEKIQLHEGLERIEFHAFDGSKISELILPESINYLEKYFCSTNCHVTVYCKGAREKWEKMFDELGLIPHIVFIHSTWYFYSEAEPTEEGNYWHYVDGKPTPWGEE